MILILYSKSKFHVLFQAPYNFDIDLGHHFVCVCVSFWFWFAKLKKIWLWWHAPDSPRKLPSSLTVWKTDHGKVNKIQSWWLEAIWTWCFNYKSWWWWSISCLTTRSNNETLEEGLGDFKECSCCHNVDKLKIRSWKYSMICAIDIKTF